MENEGFDIDIDIDSLDAAYSNFYSPSEHLQLMRWLYFPGEHCIQAVYPKKTQTFQN